MTAPDRPLVSGLLHRKQRDSNGVADGAEDAVARAASGSGSPLPDTLMRKFGASLGADLSSVRVHTGAESAAAADAVGARAFAVGQNIHFGAGQYDPSGGAGQHLLAHEVAHTVQQGSGTPARQNKLAVSGPSDGAEVDADRAADAMVTGAKYSVGGAGPGVHRDSNGPSYASHAAGTEEKRQAMPSMGSAAYAQEYDNTCLDAAKKIVDGVQKLYKLADTIETQSSKGKVFNDKDGMALAKQLRDTAKAMQGMKQGWDTLKQKKFDFSKSNLAQEPELPKVLEVLKASKDSVVQAFDTSEALAAFEAKPNRQTAKAWADNVAKQFTAAKSIVGALPFPPGCGFMKDYFQGLLGAPAAYIGAFQAIADKRYDKLDEDMGGANSDMQLEEPGMGIVWKGGGPVQNLVRDSYTAPNGHALWNWLKAHKSIQGVDMQKQPPIERAKALFIMAIAGDDKVSQEDRDAWSKWIQGYAG